MRPSAGDEKRRGGGPPPSTRKLKTTTKHSVMGRKEMTRAQQEDNEANGRR